LTGTATTNPPFTSSTSTVSHHHRRYHPSLPSSQHRHRRNHGSWTIICGTIFVMSYLRSEFPRRGSKTIRPRIVGDEFARGEGGSG
jgi:hypothetical protein